MPGTSAALNHEVSVDIDRWKRELNARELPPVQGKLAGAGRTSVTRKEVVDPWRSDPDSRKRLPIALLLACLGVEYTRPPAPPATGRTSRSPKEGRTTSRNSLDIGSRRGTSKEAYRTLTTDKGARRIPWFGPAFSTKFLYFAQGSAVHPQHVILDRVVSKDLRFGRVAAGAHCRLVARDIRPILRAAWALGRSSKQTAQRKTERPSRRDRANPLQAPSVEYLEATLDFQHNAWRQPLRLA